MKSSKGGCREGQAGEADVMKTRKWSAEEPPGLWWP